MRVKIAIAALLVSATSAFAETTAYCEVGLVNESWKSEPFSFVKNADGTTNIPCAEAHRLADQLNFRHNHGENAVEAKVYAAKKDDLIS